MIESIHSAIVFSALYIGRITLTKGFEVSSFIVQVYFSFLSYFGSDYIVYCNEFVNIIFFTCIDGLNFLYISSISLYNCLTKLRNSPK